MAKRYRYRMRVPAVQTPLRTVRQTRSLTQSQLAGVLAVSQQTYSKYESGVLVPDGATRVRIAAILGVTVSTLWPRRYSNRSHPSGLEARV